MKTKISFIIFTISILLFEIINTVKSFQIQNELTRNSSTLMDEIQFLQNKINELESQLNLQTLENNISIKNLTDSVNNANETQIKTSEEIIKDIKNTKDNSLSQFNETKKMKEKYDTILEENSKRTIETAFKNTDQKNEIEKAETLFSQKRYKDAYVICGNILAINEDNLDIRLLKTLSLFYANPMDSTKYPEIENEIKYLKLAGITNDEISKIEKQIIAEKGGSLND